MDSYDHKEIESKWQEKWEKSEPWKVSEDSSKDKYYVLMEFPYPSGDGLHTGHVRGYTAMDIVARKRRAEGKNVLFPIGWDAFGLPTENYAIKTGVHPSVVTKQNTDNFRKQFKSLGMSFDWSREINTTDPNYYKWTQWIFLQFFKKGLAYKAKSEINWCPSCKIGLANEEAVGGICDRCGGGVEKREKEQWMLAITKYADRLDKDLDTVDFWDKIKIQQRNWIGRSEGLVFKHKVKDSDLQFKTFSAHFKRSHADSYIVIASDHPFLKELVKGTPNEKEILEKSREMTIRRSQNNYSEKEIDGIFTGHYAIDPLSGYDMPIWVASFAIADYGTGIVRCSMFDDRDVAFAEKYNIPLKKESRVEEAKYFINLGVAEKKVMYRLRDWVFSRQRYWGEPIPLVFCDKDGWVAIPEDQLPVELPELPDFKPTDTGESPLAKASGWFNTTCPSCNGPAKRETDVMPNWAGSSWYYLRYTDPHNREDFASKKNLEYWTPVDWYNGGMEHTTLHLLYPRFWHKFLFDMGVVPTSEPYAKRTSHGLILAEGGEKMSKSKGNVINPDKIVEQFGADTLRLYEMFIGPFDQAVAWSEESIVGPRRFIERVWRMKEKVIDNSKLTVHNKHETLVHKTIKKLGEDIESLSLNTAVSALMILAGELDKENRIGHKEYTTLLRLLAPLAPHVTEELWHELGHATSIHQEAWPTFDPVKILEEEVEIAVQINGKVRGTVKAKRGSSEAEITALAKTTPKIEETLKNSSPKKVVYVPDRVINFVI